MSEGRCYHERAGYMLNQSLQPARTGKYEYIPAPPGSCDCVEANAYDAGVAATNTRWRDAVRDMQTEWRETAARQAAEGDYYSANGSNHRVSALDDLLRALGEDA